MSEPLDLEAIAARAEAATSGPWLAVETGSGFGPGLCMRAGPAYSHPEMMLDEADGAFIAYALSDVQALLVEVQRLRAVLNEEATHHGKALAKIAAVEGLAEGVGRMGGVGGAPWGNHGVILQAPRAATPSIGGRYPLRGALTGN